MMKKLFLVFVGLLLALSLVRPAWATEKVTLEFYYSTTCPHCARESQFLKKLEKKYDQLEIERYDTGQPLNRKRWYETGKNLGVAVGSVPFTVIGDKFFTGFGSEATTGQQIEAAVIEALGGEETIAKEAEGKVKLPFVGRVDPKSLSLPVLTFLVALLDGFNPCAMWILLFLISLLLPMEDRKRMWLLGGTFILVSGLLYFLVLAAWLNLFLLVGVVQWVRLAVGIFALGAGGWSLREWWLSREGCEVIDDQKRNRLFKRMREVVKKRSLWLALVGMAVLAVGVNMIELACSAGLPAIYTQVLALNSLPAWQYYLYLLFYVLIFMLDDMVVFVIAMVTLRAVGVESKYSRWTRLIGGVVMFLIGLAMLFKPELLTFG